MKNRNQKNNPLKALKSERVYQDINWPHEEAKPVEGYIVLLNHYVQKLNEAYTMNHSDTDALHVIRKIGGIVLRCGEEHELPHRKEL